MKSCPYCGFEPLPHDARACPLCERDPGEMDATPTLALPDSPHGVEATLGESERDRTVLEIGSAFAGRFRVEGLCGRGGMGTVYRVVDEVDGRRLALKILHPDVARDTDGLERFQREAEILARIRHPAVPLVFRFATAPEPYLITEFVDGRTLKDEIQSRGALPPAEAAALCATLAGALQVAHENGVVHRDVKPQNVMLARDGSVKLLDFGIARNVAFDAKTITRTGMTMGTPEYMSPEQLTSHRVDARSDIYSLGVVLFELVTGQPPFVADTPFGVALKHKTERAPAARERNRQVPAWLERTILRCMEKDKAARYATARELAADLSRARGSVLRRPLPTGDAVVEDAGEASDWALVLSSPKEKPGWTAGMALVFDDRYYRLDEILPPVKAEGWMYHFSFWDSTNVFRKVVDYAQDCAERKTKEDGLLSSKIRRFFRGA
jgi:serine/threonine protein kinase